MSFQSGNIKVRSDFLASLRFAGSYRIFSMYFYTKMTDMGSRLKGFFSVILLLLVLVSTGQEDDSQEFRTIFGSDFSSGGYGAPELKLGNVRGVTSLFVGGRGGWIIGHRFVIGGGGYGMTTSNTFMEDPADKPSSVPSDSTRNIKLDMGYGGLLLEFIAMPKSAVHLSFPVLIGGGGSNLGAQTYVGQSNYYQEGWATYDFIENSGFFVLEPGVFVELNMTKFFVLSAGGTYRFITGVNMQRLNSSDLSGATFSLALKFGGF